MKYVPLVRNGCRRKRKDKISFQVQGMFFFFVKLGTYFTATGISVNLVSVEALFLVWG
jgi:hypothetical protein